MIGRQREIKTLNRLYNSNKAELIAIYGRRRVGKTYLVNETFAGRITFHHAALSPEDEEAEDLEPVGTVEERLTRLEKRVAALEDERTVG